MNPCRSSNNVILENRIEDDREECDEKVLARQIITNRVRRNAVDDVSGRPSKILHNEFKNSDISTRTIHHRKSYPVPKRTGEIQNALKSMNIITNDDENFMFLNDFSWITVIV